MGRNHVPDHSSDLMKKDFGTVVLITDPKSDYYMNLHKKKSENKDRK
tara:strand:+ start:322 stop:462 length:141 start_codon:yes stop_codon:yes gene_type:complete